MAAKSTLYNIFADLVDAVKNIVEPRFIFLQERPNVKNGDVPMSRFVVIELPIDMRDQVIGHRKTFIETSGVFYAFTQARSNNTLDVNTMGGFVDEITALFPIVGKYCVAVNPAVRLRGSDGDGFQVTTITFDLRSRWGVFERKNNNET